MLEHLKSLARQAKCGTYMIKPQARPELARFVVELEFEPSFYASPVEKTSLALDAPPDAQTP